MQGLLPPNSSVTGVRFRAAFFHHFFAHRHAAGEKDVVKHLIQQGFVFRAAAFHYGDIFRREAFAHNGADHSGYGGGVCRGFDDAAVACSDGADQRVHGQHERVIPGGHDQHDAVGVGDREAFGVELSQRRGSTTLFHPVGQVLLDVAQFRERHANLAHVAFRGRFVQVCAQRSVDVLFVGEDRQAQTGQRVPAIGIGQGFSCVEKGPFRATVSSMVMACPPSASACNTSFPVPVRPSAWARDRGIGLFGGMGGQRGISAARISGMQEGISMARFISHTQAIKALAAGSSAEVSSAMPALRARRASALWQLGPYSSRK